jgi:hypothetical protein
MPPGPTSPWASWASITSCPSRLGLFFVEIHTLGGSALVRWFLILLIWDRKIDPGKVFDLTFHSSGRPM